MAIVQVRDVPDEVRAKLKARAKERGTSLSEYLREELERLAEEPTLEEIIDRVAAHQSVSGISSAELIRREREARTRRLAGG